ncbi:MAG: hypothetical protein ACXAD7_22900 [Candidatus Kariarchaeaceae archaeon]|jgi:predicted lactoylglutathione lyase
MKLGSGTHIVRGVQDLASTLPYYELLGYSLLDKGSPPTMPMNFALLTDGRINILINEGNMVYTGLIYFDIHTPKTIDKLEQLGIEFISKSSGDDMPAQAMFLDPNQFPINLVTFPYNEKTRPDVRNGVSKVDFGKFGELAIPVTDFDTSEEFWNTIGYSTLHKSSEPYNWGILSDDMMVIGLHEVNDYTSPTITYFDPNMGSHITKLEERGITITSLGDAMINCVSNAPDGQQFFFFSGEI